MTRLDLKVKDNLAQKQNQLKVTKRPEDKINLLYELAQGLFHTDIKQARKYAIRALRIARQENYLAKIANLSNFLADIFRLEGKIDLALKYTKRALVFSRRAKDSIEEANSYNTLGLILWHKGEFDKAIEGFKQSLELSKKTKNDLILSRTHTNLSLLYWEKGNLNLAMEYQKSGLAIKEKLGDSHSIGISQLNLGLIYGDLGDWDKAIECYYRALVEMEKHDDKTDIALCYNNLGEIYLRQNKLDKAREFFEAAIKNADKVDSPWVKAEALGNIGEVYFRTGDWLRARDCYNQDLKLSAEMDDKEEIAETFRRLGELLLNSGEKEEANKMLHKGLELVERTGAKKEHGNILRFLGQLYFELNDPGEAKSAFQKGLEILKEFGNNFELGKIYLDYGRVLADYGDREIALTYLQEAKEVFRNLGANYELAKVDSALTKLGVERDKARSLLNDLSMLALDSNSFNEFGTVVLKLLKNSLAFESGAISVPGEDTVKIGELSSEELERKVRKPELPVEPSSTCCPIDSKRKNLGLLYLKWNEEKKATIDKVLLETISNIIALGIERLSYQAGKKLTGLKPMRREISSRVVIGSETSLKGIFDAIQKAAPTKACVLIQGESGTGKELVARAIHNFSERADNPFVPINCAAIPETLLESELFGIEKGTATGVAERKGKFELAHTGTVFLDEIGDMGLAIQAKILRLLQEKQLERVGGRKSIDVDIRIIAATNKCLEKAIAEGKFRDDLYYRLNVVSLLLPTLRERKEDIPQLVSHFIDKYSREYQRNIENISEEVLARFFNYSWPGNVRELENIIERAVVLTRSNRITLADLPPVFQQVGENNIDFQQAKNQAKAGAEFIEKDFLIQTLNRCNWNFTKAAKSLNITRRHLYRLSKRFGIERK